MASEKPIPIIVCGRSEQIGAGVIAGLEPKYEVVHFIQYSEVCATEVLSILKGEAPPNPSSTIASGNLTDRPVAIAMGGAYDNSFDEIHDAVEEASGPGGTGVAWLRNDTTKPGPDVLGAQYPQSVVDRIRNVLDGLEAGSKGVHLY